jgi:hypothetical protein
MQEIKDYMKENEEKVSKIQKEKELWLAEQSSLIAQRDSDLQESSRLKHLLS